MNTAGSSGSELAPSPASGARAVLAAARERFLGDFAALERELAKTDPTWLARRRREAIERFAELGLPTARHEDWKHTSLVPLARIAFAPASEPTASARAAITALAAEERRRGPTLVFVNGRLARELSSSTGLPEGVEAFDLAGGLVARNDLLEAQLAGLTDGAVRSLAALGTAFARDGAVVRVAPGASVAVPLRLLFVTAGADAPVMAHTRNLISAGRGSQARLLITQVAVQAGEAPTFTNHVTDVALAANARLQVNQIVHPRAGSFQLGSIQARQERDSALATCTVSFGAALTRTEIIDHLDAEGASASIDGVYLASSGELVDNFTRLEHRASNTTTQELYRGVIDGDGHAVWSGRILIVPQVKQVNAEQTNNNLLLSDQAEADTRPQLEIYANDVKCTHGATVGRLDDKALFYLRSRGLGAAEARTLLIQAFTRQVLARVADEGLRRELDAQVAARLGAPTGSDRMELA